MPDARQDTAERPDGAQTRLSDRGPEGLGADGSGAPRSWAGERLAPWFLAPLLIFLVVHGVLNALASNSESSFAAIGRITHGAWWNGVVIGLFFWIPLIGTVACAIAARAGSARRTLLATCCGVAALAFVGWHVWETSAQRALGRRTLEDLYSDLAASLSGTVAGIPLASLGYLVGAAAAGAFLGSAAFDAWSGDLRKTDGAGGRKLVVTVLACGIYLVFAGTVIEYATGSVVP